MALLTNMTLCVSTVSVIIVVLVGNVSKNPVHQWRRILALELVQR